MAGKVNVAFCSVAVPVVVAVMESSAWIVMPSVKFSPVIVNSTEPPEADRFFVAGVKEVTAALLSVTVMVKVLEVISPADAVTV